MKSTLFYLLFLAPVFAIAEPAPLLEIPVFGGTTGRNAPPAPPVPQIDAAGRKVWLRDDITRQLKPTGKRKPTKQDVLALLGTPDTTQEADTGDKWKYRNKSKDPITQKTDAFILIEFCPSSFPYRAPATSSLGALGGGGVSNYSPPAPTPNQVLSIYFYAG